MAAAPVTFSAPGVTGAAPASVQEAFLAIHEPPKTPTDRNPGAQIGTVKFQYNPKELSLTKSASWERKAQKKTDHGARPQYLGSDPCKLQLEMFLDATEKMDDGVVKAVERLFSCMVCGEGRPTPPWVIFNWGGLTGFPAFVSSVTAKYTLFTPGGMPVRALCTIAVEEVFGTTKRQNPTSGSLAARDVHVVVAGDTLAGMAYAYYGEPGFWREIAKANRIGDPMRLRPGARLLIPAREELGGG
ncbi:LysM peptidoglycan-binding domain-containing protein [Planotetraspora phitsanulokensis]|uniref:Peptidase M23 n=1 Tax=Planotetraspora phitsanulokensis TaxID=575192 RepID=A0A8J3XCL2_9ACTN|nr:LysM peptidoglycan-binding domain-containing protein [Planotetraspora phitsanulokensis]GII36262.1 peptidase M23 [Planotetraspora phitsanulokensis]